MHGGVTTGSHGVISRVMLVWGWVSKSIATPREAEGKAMAENKTEIREGSIDQYFLKQFTPEQ